jgi:thiamine-phosphate diphosphorylase
VRPVLMLITDRHRLGATWRGSLPSLVGAAARAGVQMIQVRERDLEGGALTALVRHCLDAVKGTAARVLVNDRVDVALAANAHGVHLRGNSVPAYAVRAMANRSLLIGRSVHSSKEAIQVTADGHLDYLLFGPVFETASKPGRSPAGLMALGDVAATVTVPVIAVGGISPERLPLTIRNGAVGAAAIGLFASASVAELQSVVDVSRSLV